MKVIISQPRYLPFLPYLQRLKQADLFVFLDDVQRQGRGFENRNRILNRGKPIWLTIPISSSSREKICSTKISNTSWIAEHLNKISTYYANHPFYDSQICNTLYANLPLYHGTMDYVSNILKIMMNTTKLFNFTPNYILASSLDIDHTLTGPKHLVDILRAVNADTYISGPNGKNYNIEQELNGEFKIYYNHPYSYPYNQPMNPSFIPYLAFIDEIFCCGIESVRNKIFSELKITRA